MSTDSEIILTAEALQVLVVGGIATPAMYDPRDDGRFNLRVSAEVRQKLDRVAVMTTFNHSEIILYFAAFMERKGAEAECHH